MDSIVSEQNADHRRRDVGITPQTLWRLYSSALRTSCRAPPARSSTANITVLATRGFKPLLALKAKKKCL